MFSSLLTSLTAAASTSAPVPAPLALADLSDEALMARAGGGDHEAFALLFRRHERGARTFAGRTLNDFDRAEDVVQDAFTELWRQAPLWKPSAKFRTYLFLLISRRCIDTLRRIRPESLDDMAEHTLPPARTVDVRATIGAEQERALLAGAIQQLPERQRMAVLLVYTEGFPQQDAADAMGLHLKAFESLLHRARQTLRERLNPPEATRP